MPDKYEIKYGCTTESLNPDADGEFVWNQVGGNGWQHPWIHNSRYALLIGGDIYSKDGTEYIPAFWNEVNDAFNMLVNTGFIDDNLDYSWSDDDHIFILFYDTTSDRTTAPKIIDNSASVTTVRMALDALATRTTKNDLFLFLTVCHGGSNLFSMQPGVGPTKNNCYYGYPPELELASYEMDITEINTVQYARSVIVIQSCESGGAIRNAHEYFIPGEGFVTRSVTPLMADNRIIVTSSRIDKYSYTTPGPSGGKEHWKFIHSFITTLKSGDISIKDAFDDGKSAASGELPQLEDNGDCLCEQNTDPDICGDGEYFPGYVYDDGLTSECTYI